MNQFAPRRITAVLGPTNTGKTYLAIERLLAYRSGIIGFPLRLLARENYDRAVKIKGARQVALVTGEEKIIPPGARYFFCTVESMPVDRPAAFLAVDEIQLCADPERGHVFTDRLLHARGTEETMFLGAETIRPVLKRLVPEAEYISRPRFSTLSYSGPKKITRLPPRSAVVAFSAADVYAMAELMRRQRGGTAVIMGALSPRTRNAQVGLFESGDVDYLVATDAIGMGLNLSLDHVAFARLSKFDGRVPRRLTAAEIAQIAGRAGRHMNDGSFGTTSDLGGLDPETVEAVEEHRFHPLHQVFWRNDDLDFRSPRALLKSLEARPALRALWRVRGAEDHMVLAALAADPEIEALARHPDAVRLLWAACQIPDFQKILTGQHAALIRRVYRHLMADEGRLPTDWVAKQIARIDRTDGDIDALVARIAQVRTWTYITHRGDWLEDAQHWQGRARAIEDRLSDALHDCLTQRFVDRRSAALIRRLKDGGELLGAVKSNGEVTVEGEHVGRLDGFRFEPDELAVGDDCKPLMAAARRALAREIPARVNRFEGEEARAFRLTVDGKLLWCGSPVARLAAGSGLLAPRIAVLDNDFLDGAQRERLRKRLSPWLDDFLRRRLAALYRARDADLAGAARGLVFQLVETLGTLPRKTVKAQLGALSKADRRALGDLGVRFGTESLFLTGLGQQKTVWLRALLWSVHTGRNGHAMPARGAPSFDPDGRDGPDDQAFCLALGYRLLRSQQGSIAIRADALERLARAARKLAVQGSFAPTAALQDLAGCDQAGLSRVLAGLGYRFEHDPAGPSFRAPKSSANGRHKGANGKRKPGAKTAEKRVRRKKKRPPIGDTPFAKLRALKIAP